MIAMQQLVEYASCRLSDERHDADIVEQIEPLALREAEVLYNVARALHQVDEDARRRRCAR